MDFGGYSQAEQFACSLWGDNGIYDIIVGKSRIAGFYAPQFSWISPFVYWRVRSGTWPTRLCSGLIPMRWQYEVTAIFIGNYSSARMISRYPLVIEHSHGKSQFLIGKPSLNGPFPMAMLNNQRVGNNLIGLSPVPSNYYIP